MPFPVSRSLLAKCSSTLVCYLRAAPLWVYIVLVFLLGAAGHRILALLRGDELPAPTAAAPRKARTAPGSAQAENGFRR